MEDNKKCVSCFHLDAVVSCKKSSIHSNIGLKTDFYQTTRRLPGEMKVKWSDLAQLGTEWEAINVYQRRNHDLLMYR